MRNPSHAWLLAALVVLGLLLQAASLGSGFYADDYVLSWPFREDGALVPMRPWNVFDFGTRADWIPVEQVHGAMPWWTSPDWSVRFLRPLASLSLWLDHVLWGAWAPGHHLTSLGLYALLLVLVAGLYRALGLSRGLALLGLALFVVSDSSVVPVGWLANRNSLLEAVFSVAALIVALRGGPNLSSIAAALVLAAGATLSKESGALAFLLVGLALVKHSRARDDPQARLRARAAGGAAVAAFVAWFALLGLAGYGTASLYYATPWRDPLRFLSNLGVLITGGGLSLAGPFPLDVVVAAPQLRTVVVLIGALIGIPLWAWIARTLRHRPEEERRAARWLGLWALAFLLPRAGATPGDRLLFVASIGACGLLALHLAVLRESSRRGELGWASRLVGVVLLVAATLGSGAYLVAQSLGMAHLANHLRTTALATEVGPTTSGRVHVLVLQTDNQMQGFTLAATWHGAGGDRSVQFMLLQSGARPVRWTRLSETDFELESLGAPFLNSPFEGVYLAREPDPERDGPWSSGLFEIEALPHPSGELRRLRFSCVRSLDDPVLRFVLPVEGVLTRVAVPAVGESRELSAPVPALPLVP